MKRIALFVMLAALVASCNFNQSTGQELDQQVTYETVFDTAVINFNESDSGDYTVNFGDTLAKTIHVDYTPEALYFTCENIDSFKVFSCGQEIQLHEESLDGSMTVNTLYISDLPGDGDRSFDAKADGTVVPFELVVSTDSVN